MGLPTVKLGGSKPRPYELVIDTFAKGLYSYFDTTRLPNDAAAASQNLMQKEDGIWVTRPGTVAYGPTISGSIDGAKEGVVYDASGVPSQKLFVHHNGLLDYCIDGGSLTNIVGSLTAGHPVMMAQTNYHLYVTNGYDPLGFVDLNVGAGLSWNTFTSIATPSAPTDTLNGSLTNVGSNPVRYMVSAVNAVGETLASTALALTLNKPRIAWIKSGTTPDSIDLSWTAVVGATGYNIYYGTLTGYENFLSSSTGTTFHDDGTIFPNQSVTKPKADTTTGPKGAFIDLAMGRIWVTQDPGNVHRVYCAGVGNNSGEFSPYYGGVYVDLGQGTNERPIAVRDYRTATGSAAAIVWTATPSGAGSTYIIQLVSQTVGDFVVYIPQVTKVTGSVGTNAPRSITEARNSMLYMSPKGAFSVGNRPNIPNILSTDELTVNIRNDVANITNSAASQACGGYWKGKWWLSLANGFTQNNEIWILDLEHLNWSRPFTIGVKQFLEYTDSGGVVHYLAIPVTGSKLIEFQENQFNDQGVAFETRNQTGIIPIGPSHNDWAQIDYAYVELGRATGLITFTLYGTEYGKPYGKLTQPITYNFASQAWAGYSTFVYSTHMYTDTRYYPKTILPPTVMKEVRVFKTVKDLMFEIHSFDGGTFYKILRYAAKGRLVKRQDPTNQFS